MSMLFFLSAKAGERAEVVPHVHSSGAAALHLPTFALHCEQFSLPSVPVAIS